MMILPRNYTYVCKLANMTEFRLTQRHATYSECLLNAQIKETHGLK